MKGIDEPGGINLNPKAPVPSKCKGMEGDGYQNDGPASWGKNGSNSIPR